VIAFFVLRGLETAKPRPFNRAAVAAGFQSVFSDPRAKVCFGSVFFEGIFIHGLFPYVALLLLASGQTHSSYAGLIIAGFGLGGIVYSLSVSVIVARLTERQVMLTGATFACIALVLISLNMAWYIQAIVFMVFGFGFYMLHTCIQLHVTELSQTARGAALSMHSCSFYFGQAIGPIYYGFGYSHAGLSAPTLLGAVVIMVIGLVCARLLRHRHHPPGVAAERASGGH
jgi:predicted MFS family arabinose efflux permease